MTEEHLKAVREGLKEYGAAYLVGLVEGALGFDGTSDIERAREYLRIWREIKGQAA